MARGAPATPAAARPTTTRRQRPELRRRRREQRRRRRPRRLLLEHRRSTTAASAPRSHRRSRSSSSAAAAVPARATTATAAAWRVTGAQDAQASSGAAGGGLIVIRAGTLSVPAAATLSADGSAAFDDTLKDGGGGGGAGGSIVLTVTDVDDEHGQPDPARERRPRRRLVADLGVRTAPLSANRHGPGGGGGGGVIAYTVTAGAARPSRWTAALRASRRRANDTFGALPGGIGQTLTATPAQIPGRRTPARSARPRPRPDDLAHALGDDGLDRRAGDDPRHRHERQPVHVDRRQPTFGLVTATITLDPGLDVPRRIASAPGLDVLDRGPGGDLHAVDRARRPAELSADPDRRHRGRVGRRPDHAHEHGDGQRRRRRQPAEQQRDRRDRRAGADSRAPQGVRGASAAAAWSSCGGGRASSSTTSASASTARRRGSASSITPRILAGSAFAVGKDRPLPSGRSYAWIDREPAGDARYWLEDIDLDGSKQWTGPVVAEDGPGEGGWGPATAPAPSPALAGPRPRAGEARPLGGPARHRPRAARAAAPS